MKKWMMLTMGTCLIALAITALPPTVAEAPVPVADEVLFSTVLDTLTAPVCELDGMASGSFLPGGGYECPSGVPYCFWAQRCVAFCAGGDPVCEFGCCACAS